MKYLKRFNERLYIYDPAWESFLPNQIIVIKGQYNEIQRVRYTRGNIMLNSDMIQITYYFEGEGAPDTLEIDIYMAQYDTEKSYADSTTVVSSGSLSYENEDLTKNKNLRLDVDITFGDEMACEFTIDEKSGVNCFQQTSYGSKFDQSNTLFAFEDSNVRQLVAFFNRFGFRLSGRKTPTTDLGNLEIEDFNFLRNI